MAKKSKLAQYRSRRKAKANPEAKATKELAVNIGAGFAGYAATRLISRMAYSQAIKRWPNGAAYANVIASAIGATGVYFGSKHWSKIADHHEAASIGAGIALLQTAVQTFVPKFGWIVGDVSAEQYVATKEKRELPDADLDSLLPSDNAPELAAPAEDTFSLDALLAERPDMEAVPIGQSEPSVDAGLIEDGVDDIEHFNGMMH